MSANHGDDVLARLKRLSDQLDTAQKSADVVAKEIEHARKATDATKNVVRRRQPERAVAKKRLGKKR